VSTRALAAFAIGPAVGLGIGVWAEFADLSPPLLLAVATPAMAVALAGSAWRTTLMERPAMLIVAGAALGLLTFLASEGTYLAIHRAHGGFLNFEAFESQEAMAAGLLAVHAFVGTIVGLAVGAAVAGVALAARMRPRTRVRARGP
jgi:hypothetical protein